MAVLHAFPWACNVLQKPAMYTNRAIKTVVATATCFVPIFAIQCKPNGLAIVMHAMLIAAIPYHRASSNTDCIMIM